MSKVLLISLVSDQTIPNVKLIKEFQHLNPNYLFVTTEQMERKGTRGWIEKTSGITHSEVVVVNENSTPDVANKLKTIDYGSYGRIIVNLTGGTKMMSLGVHQCLSGLNTEYYYVPGNDDSYLLVDGATQTAHHFSSQISIFEYLTAYGFSIPESAPHDRDLADAQALFEKYCALEGDYTEAWRTLLKAREKGKIKMEQMDSVRPLLQALDFHSSDDKLSPGDLKYITGEWFELYIGLTLRQELGLSDEEVLIGRHILKNVQPRKDLNDTSEMLGIDADEGLENKNEIDVMFMYDNKFHYIECKTSIVAERRVENAKGEILYKPYSILGETIYKADSIKSKFGLFAKTTIVTLTDFIQYAQSVKDGSRLNSLKSDLNRANLSNIKVIDRKRLLGASSISSLILK